MKSEISSTASLPVVTIWRNRRLRGRARSKNAKPRPPLCEMIETWPRPSACVGVSGPALLSIAGLKFAHSEAAMLAKPSVFGPLDRHVVAARGGGDLALHARSGFARFGKAGAENDGCLDPGAAATLELRRHIFGGNDEHRHVDRLGQRVD